MSDVLCSLFELCHTHSILLSPPSTAIRKLVTLLNRQPVTITTHQDISPYVIICVSCQFYYVHVLGILYTCTCIGYTVYMYMYWVYCINVLAYNIHVVNLHVHVHVYYMWIRVRVFIHFCVIAVIIIIMIILKTPPQSLEHLVNLHLPRSLNYLILVMETMKSFCYHHQVIVTDLIIAFIVVVVVIVVVVYQQLMLLTHGFVMVTCYI